MDKVNAYREAIKTLLKDYSSLTANQHNGIETQLLFDEQNDHYQLMYVGWRNRERVYGICDTSGLNQRQDLATIQWY